MKKYVSQLLTDLKAAESKIPPTPNYKELYPDHPAHDYGLEHIVAWECTPFQTMSELFGIESDAFPPDDKLTDRQVSVLAKGIMALWLAFGTDVDIPKKTPKRKLYSVLIDAWRNEPMQYIPNDGGFSTFEFCNLDPETCKWGAYCGCIKKVKQWEIDHADFDRRFEAGEFDNIEPYVPSSKSYDSPDIDWGDNALPF